MTTETQTALRERVQASRQRLEASAVRFGPKALPPDGMDGAILTLRAVESFLALLPLEPVAQEPSVPRCHCGGYTFSCSTCGSSIHAAPEPAAVPAQDGPVCCELGLMVLGCPTCTELHERVHQLEAAQDGPEPSVEPYTPWPHCECTPEQHAACKVCSPAPALPPHQDVETLRLEIESLERYEPAALGADAIADMTDDGPYVLRSAVLAALARRAPADQGQREDL